MVPVLLVNWFNPNPPCRLPTTHPSTTTPFPAPTEFGMDPSHFMRDIYGLSIMVGVYLTLAFVFLWTCVRERR